MPRIPHENRLLVVDNHLAHYAQANTVNGSPFVIETGFGRPQLLLLRDAFDALRQQIAGLDEEGGELPSLRSERDDLFGENDTDVAGVWYWLKLYKGAVKSRLGGRHPLTRTVPNLGKIQPKSYLETLRRYIVHWTRVNAALPAPLTLGTHTLATMQTAQTNLKTKIDAILDGEDHVRLLRENREQMFGDVPDDQREPTSIIAWLLKYHTEILARFPHQPIAATLPEIFPGGPVSPPPPHPSLAFNYIAQPNSVLKTWFAIAGIPTGAATVFLKEGAVEMSKPVRPNPPNGMHTDFWDGITLVGDLDEFELRTAGGLTLAVGARQPTLPEPIVTPPPPPPPV